MGKKKYNNLMNYTTKISAEDSIAEIEKILLKFGATNIMKSVNNGRFSAVMFTVGAGAKQFIFKLPVTDEKVKTVCKLLYKNYRSTVRQTDKTEDSFSEQAYRTTWRFIKDWIHAQMSIIATEMVTLEEVFLPYVMVDKDHTLADKLKSGELQNLLPEYQP